VAIDCAALRARYGNQFVAKTAASRDEQRSCVFTMERGRIVATGVAMPQFARNLSVWMQRVVVGRTNLTGRFDIDVAWEMLPLQVPPVYPPERTAIESTRSSVSAVRQQLGLELQPTRAPVDVLVIDSASPLRDQ
jgi:uncharacterized protein (TIGR03435 family)